MSESKIFWNKFGGLENNEELTEYMKRAYEHGNYYHYTKLNVINSILEKREFWLSNVSCYNDKKDSGVFDDTKRYFSLCFSTGVNENLSLWYLYSGIDGKGGRLKFTKNQIKKLIITANYKLYEKESNTKLNFIMELNEEDIKWKFQDILYFNKNKDIVDIKYNTMTNHIFPLSEFEKYEKENTGFLKSIIWYYEKETRLLIELIGNAAKKLNGKKEYVITLSLDKVIDKIKIDMAPEIDKEEMDDYLKKYKSIDDHLKNTSNVQLSKYHGQLDMNLCKNCKNEKPK